MKGRLRSSLLALVLIGSPLGALAEGQAPGFDWLGNPLPASTDVLDELEDSVDPMAGRKPLPNAIQKKGTRPKSDPSVLPPAATTLSPNLDQLAAPAPLALPNQPAQVRPEELRPITLTQAVELMEVNNPFLEAVKIRWKRRKAS